MRSLRLLGAAATATASLDVGTRPSEFTASHSSGGLRRPQNDTSFRRVRDATCNRAAGEKECHDEVGRIVACAQPGGECPCFAGEERCRSPRFGEYCDIICCDWRTQEKCRKPDHDDPDVYDEWCADVADGGCPCPDGEVKCGVTEIDGGHSSYCTTLCCEEGEQTCYDEDYDPASCALISEGGCPCPDGQVKCGGTDDWAGYCTEACCNPATEETCYDANAKKICRKMEDGGCAADETGHGMWSPRMASVILSRGTGSQVEYYAAIRERREKLLAAGEGFNEDEVATMMKHLEAEEASLFHAVRARKSRPKKKSPPSLEEIASIF